MTNEPLPTAYQLLYNAPVRTKKVKLSYRILYTIFLFLVSFFVFLPSSSPAFAQTRPWADLQNDFSGRDYGCVVDYQGYQVPTIRGIECLVANVLSVAITIIGLAGFVMMIIASFRYLISGGNAKGVEAARNSITYAVIGLVVALSAYFILNILAQFTGISLITRFEIPQL